MATYKTVTYEDRKKIEKMYKSGMSMDKDCRSELEKTIDTVYPKNYKDALKDNILQMKLKEMERVRESLLLNIILVENN